VCFIYQVVFKQKGIYYEWFYSCNRAGFQQ
jgi:hypothetical protein